MGWFNRRKPKTRKRVNIVAVPSGRPAKNQVRPDNTPLHIKRGWKQKKNIYKGYYRTRHGAWPGVIHRRGDIFEVFIFNPPVKQLENHSRWICIHHIKGSTYNIHLAKNPKNNDVGAIIVCVEKIIIESFRLS